MFFTFEDIVLKLNLTKHYEDEPEESKILYISINVQVPDDLLSCNKLEDTFNYADYEMRLIEIFDSKNFELIEEVASLILDFTKEYSDKIISCHVSIKKKNILKNAKSITMSVWRNFKEQNHS